MLFTTIITKNAQNIGQKTKQFNVLLVQGKAKSNKSKEKNIRDHPYHFLKNLIDIDIALESIKIDQDKNFIKTSSLTRMDRNIIQRRTIACCFHRINRYDDQDDD